MADVPCGHCRACCINQRILLEPEEVGKYASVATARGDGPVVHMLAHKKESGECHYLQGDGCSIHSKVPKACREFDCRSWLKKFSADEQIAMWADGLDGEVVRAAIARAQ